jgi:beta-lactamase regulating signal transducer with metallopeptidase domain
VNHIHYCIILHHNKRFHKPISTEVLSFRVEILTAIIMDVAIFWDITSCRPYVNRCIGGTDHHQVVFLCSVRWLLALFLVHRFLSTLMKEAPSSSETSVLTRATWHNIPEDTILHLRKSSHLSSFQIQLVFCFSFKMLRIGNTDFVYSVMFSFHRTEP